MKDSNFKAWWIDHLTVTASMAAKSNYSLPIFIISMTCVSIIITLVCIIDILNGCQTWVTFTKSLTGIAMLTMMTVQYVKRNKIGTIEHAIGEVFQTIVYGASMGLWCATTSTDSIIPTIIAVTSIAGFAVFPSKINILFYGLTYTSVATPIIFSTENIIILISLTMWSGVLLISNRVMMTRHESYRSHYLDDNNIESKMRNERVGRMTSSVAHTIGNVLGTCSLKKYTGEHPKYSFEYIMSKLNGILSMSGHGRSVSISELFNHLKIYENTGVIIDTNVPEKINKILLAPEVSNVIFDLVDNAVSAYELNKLSKGIIKIDASITKNRLVLSVIDYAGGLSLNAKPRMGLKNADVVMRKLTGCMILESICDSGKKGTKVSLNMPDRIISCEALQGT